jgi:N-acetylated-alpha-linked acidic dipeptidase
VKELGHKTKVQKNVDLRPLLGKIGELEKAGQELNAAVMIALAANTLNTQAAEKISRQLMQMESNWLTPEGIPGRPWFQHLLYAARYTYAHLELPGLTEAAENGDWKTAQAQIALLEAAVEKNTRLLREAKADIDKSSTPSNSRH